MSTAAAAAPMTAQSIKWHVWESLRWDIPTLVLAVLLIGFCWSVWRVANRSDFDLASIYKDDTGKPSATRFALVGAWVASTWYFMQDMLDGVPDPQIFWGYLVTWSGAKVLEKAIDKWSGQLPFGK